MLIVSLPAWMGFSLCRISSETATASAFGSALASRLYW
jgi:hypothetical protein